MKNNSITSPPSKSVISFSSISITDKEFELMRSLIYDNFGINLTYEKKNLIVSRLQKLLRIENFNTFQDYYDYIVSDKSGKALVELADMISTNHTFFNRENAHFDFLIKKVLPEIVTQLKERQDYKLRIWCAASSTGEEPYMLAMLLQEFLGKDYCMWDTGVLATDISRYAIKTARAGLYDEKQINLLPEGLRKKYFKNIGNTQWAVTEKLKKEVTFRFFNLVNQQFPFKKPFHIIFCRNVMIYFDKPTCNALINKMYQFTESGGYLFVGHSETLDRERFRYKYILPAVYKKTEN